MDVVEEEPEKENDSDLDSDLEDSDEEDFEITESEEQEPVQVNISALGTLIASSQKHGAFDSTAFVYQRGPEPSKKTQLRKSQRERELRKTAENTPTLHTFSSFRQFLANLQYLRLFLPLHVSLPTSANSRNSRRH